MLELSLDTSFLISFADPNRPNHGVAVEYFRHCVAEHIPMWISTVAAGEFQVKQSINDLPLRNFKIQPYNLSHAIRAAALFNQLKDASARSEERRPIIINDLKIIAQAADDKISVILTEDENTLSRMAAALREKGAISTSVFLLKDGFQLKRSENTTQTELSLPE
jgi:predicted nucleic acid-binding protein